jgi:chitinase
MEKTISTSIDYSDVVLAGNDYVYSFPRGRDRISSVDLDTEVEAPGGDGGSNAACRLHPSGQAIYYANRGSSPSDIGKR